MFSCNLRSPAPNNDLLSKSGGVVYGLRNRRSGLRSAREGETKKRQRHSAPGRRVAIFRLAFQQMIYFCADGLKIIQAEIYNGIADVRNLVHFL
jgi:hypothetical protein